MGFSLFVVFLAFKNEVFYFFSFFIAFLFEIFIITCVLIDFSSSNLFIIFYVNLHAFCKGEAYMMVNKS